LCQPHVFGRKISQAAFYVTGYIFFGAAVSYCFFDGCVRESYYSFTDDFDYMKDNICVAYAVACAAVSMTLFSILIQKCFRTRKSEIFRFCVFGFIVIAVQ
jgi:hypothetical protein